MAFLAWIALAAVCALIARSKGRNPWAWAGWGLLGGVISVAIILVKSPLGMAGPASATRSHETLNLIRELADLRDRGILSPQEFEVKKDELLNKIN
jgi:hypothetical protein